METVENKGIIYEFGKFILDPREKVLLVDGSPIRLPAKEFDTLLFLVQNNGRALSKEEMMNAIWKDAFVEEANLAKQISLLRKLLGSSGEAFIETIPKHGYRFSADVRLKMPDDGDPVVIERKTVRRVAVEYPDQPEEILPAPVMALPGDRRRSFRWVPLVVSVLLLGVLGVAAYLWYLPTSSKPETAAAVKSVAVLPFRPLGDDDQYLRLGLTDALITKLAGLKKIVVRPTNAVREYDIQDPLAVGRELGVEAVLHGSVQRAGEQVRVNLQLARVVDGALLWGGKFDEKFTSIFELQDAISDQVARALEPAGLTGDEAKLLAKHYTTNADAHYAYVKGRTYWNRRTGKDLKEAVVHFQEAIAKDPKYALAYAGLADTYSLLADYNVARPEESYPKAKEAALKALELDSELAEAHTSLAYANMYYFWDWAEVESRYRRAVVLNPNYATAHQWYSEYLTAMGRFDEALIEIRRAKEIDPLAPVLNAGEVWVLYFARRYDEAIEQGRKLAEMEPEFAEVHEYLKRSYDQKGMYREAITARQMRRKLAGYDPIETPSLKSAAMATSAQAYWAKRLEQELEDEKREGAENFDLAEIHAQLGNKDHAFEWLEKAYKDRDYLMIYLKVAPNLDPLRSDPRFDDLIRRMSLGA